MGVRKTIVAEGNDCGESSYDRIHICVEGRSGRTSLEAHWLQILTFTGKGAASIPGLCNVANKQIKTVKCLLAQKKSCSSKNPVKTL